jgi:hypothetical protein
MCSRNGRFFAPRHDPICRVLQLRDQEARALAVGGFRHLLQPKRQFGEMIITRRARRVVQPFVRRRKMSLFFNCFLMSGSSRYRFCLVPFMDSQGGRRLQE